MPVVQAETLAENLQILAKEHKRVLASNADVSAAKEQVQVALGAWYPTFDLTANYGHETRNKPTDSADTAMVPRNLDMSLTQMLWDFGSTDASIERARITFTQAQATRESTVQDLLLEAITAHLNVIRAHKLVEFSEGSSANIKRQTELEDARVQRGAGLSTDVLQAKTQFAGALAREIQAKGALKTSLNRYRAVYGFLPENITDLKNPRLPLELLPKSLDEAVELAFEGNPQLLASRLSADIARADIKKTRADEYAPIFKASAESNYKEDNGGTIGTQHERLVKVEATYSFNLAATAINTLKASEQTHIATTNRFGDTKDLVEESA
ncbi:MAG: TolC family protein [Rhodospirillales bacterium]|nr:TolC family protein [Rhodospirillales bacterium]